MSKTMTKDKLLKLKEALKENKEAFESIDFGDDTCGEVRINKGCEGVGCLEYKCLMLQLDAKIKALNDKQKNMMGACYKCKFRGSVPGDAHSCCNHPHATKLNITADKHGIKSGWFLHPINFDPTWLIYCNGFESKDKE